MYNCKHIRVPQLLIELQLLTIKKENILAEVLEFTLYYTHPNIINKIIIYIIPKYRIANLLPNLSTENCVLTLEANAKISVAVAATGKHLMKRIANEGMDEAAAR